KDMEIKHLQNQINPHFLFNTLNTLSKMAYLEDAKTTSSLIESVATLLRHNLGEIDKSVTLRDEVEVVKGYFHIQKTRFSERITFEYDVDENCLDRQIPRLTLQPLVENAFIHGIEDRDDGVGMSQSTVDQIISLNVNENEHVGHSTGIGLTNVIRRLQLFFKVDEIIEIDSKLNQGTIVRLLLPKN